MLPSSVDEITEHSRFAPKEPKLVQMTTLGPRDMRELHPLFIIPGLTGQSEIEELCRELMYPTFCAVLPSTPLSIQEIATNLLDVR